MANHKSAAKRARQTIRRNDRMSATRSAVNTAEKKLLKAIEAKKKKEAGPLLLDFTSKIDKAAQKGIVSKNRASRKVGRLSHQVHGL